MISILTGLFTLVIILLVAFLILWIIEMFLPIPPKIKQLVYVLIILGVLIYSFNHHLFHL